tara:strand:+ start:51 stop:1640 length:1590 start_codon:yes stop_codon:yes gene_type:complete
MNKQGYPGEPGIRGQKGQIGDAGTCAADCGKKVCISVLERDSHNALDYYVKKIKGSLKDSEVLERTLVKCSKESIKEKDKDGKIISLPKVDLDVCKKQPASKTNTNTSQQDDKVECVSIDTISDNIFGSDTLEIRYRIKNRLFLNKLRLLCNSKHYISTLEKEHKNKPTEKKLIEYLSSIIIKWVEMIVNYKIEISTSKNGVITKKPIFLGVIFLMSPDATFDVIESIKDDDGEILIESPLREIEKYDIWNWGETNVDSPLIVQKCITDQTPPLAIQQKLKTIYTNTYDVVFVSKTAYDSDKWDTINCPYGQMGPNKDNPDNIEVCVTKTDTKLHINDSRGIIKKRLAWKEIEYRRKNNIVFLHPKNHTDKNGKIYYPVGSVWTTLEPNKEGKYDKKTLLVTGDVTAPIDYKEIWKSTTLLGDKKPIFTENFSIWRPIPKDGYTALGDVVVKGTAKPPTNIDATPVVCVISSCLSEMPLGSEVWNTNDIGRIDYRSEENYRMYNNLGLRTRDDINIKDKNDNLDYPDNL